MAVDTQEPPIIYINILPPIPLDIDIQSISEFEPTPDVLCQYVVEVDLLRHFFARPAVIPWDKVGLDLLEIFQHGKVHPDVVGYCLVVNLFHHVDFCFPCLVRENTLAGYQVTQVNEDNLLDRNGVGDDVANVNDAFHVPLEPLVKNFKIVARGDKTGVSIRNEAHHRLGILVRLVLRGFVSGKFVGVQGEGVFTEHLRKNISPADVLFYPLSDACLFPIPDNFVGGLGVGSGGAW